MLPYDAGALFALHSRYLQESWLFALPLLIFVFSMPIWMLRGGAAVGRLITGMLALAWLWVGLVFHGFYFADINFSAPLYAGLFVLQSLLLWWHTGSRGQLVVAYRMDVAGWIGGLLLFYAVIGYPLLDYLNGHTAGVRLTGIAAGPTALLTIALLLLMSGPTPLYLFLIPALWTFVAGFSGWVLGLWADLMMPLAVVALIPALLWKRRIQPSIDRGGG